MPTLNVRGDEEDCSPAELMGPDDLRDTSRDDLLFSDCTLVIALSLFELLLVPNGLILDN